MEEKIEYVSLHGYSIVTGHTVTSNHWEATEEEIKDFTYLVCKYNLPSIEGIRMGAHYTAIDFKGYCKDLSELNDMGDRSLIAWGNTPEEAISQAYSKLQ